MDNDQLKARLQMHLTHLCKGEKLSGTPAAKEGAEYICDTLRSMGISTRQFRFSAYLSDPLSSSFQIWDGEGWRKIPSRPRSFSANCPEGVEGELIFDANALCRETLHEEREFLNQVQGKIVLAFGYDEKYAKLLDLHKAAGLIQIWESDEEEIHEDTVGPIWGTPDASSYWTGLSLPVAAVSGPTGRHLLQMQNSGTRYRAQLRTVVTNEIREVLLPVAEIRGNSSDFVLVSGHYDTWYVGAMDNGCANSLHLELAGELQALKEQGKLYRSVRFAFWPGHSNGRYMGSTWYMDHFFSEISENCIAHINSDLNGSVLTDRLAIKTTGLEGNTFHHEIMRRAGMDDIPLVFGVPGRGADQSFWGARIPYHILARFEQDAEAKGSASPGPGVWWWHTRYDVPQYVDYDILVKEYLYLSELVRTLVMNQDLPMEWNSFLEMQRTEIEQHMEGHPLAEELIKAWSSFTKYAEQDEPDRSSPKAENYFLQAAGTLNALKYTYGSSYMQDAAFSYGTYPFLRMASVQEEECPEDWYLFIQTSIRRQVNRLSTEWKKLGEEMDRRR